MPLSHWMELRTRLNWCFYCNIANTRVRVYFFLIFAVWVISHSRRSIPHFITIIHEVTSPEKKTTHESKWWPMYHSQAERGEKKSRSQFVELKSNCCCCFFASLISKNSRMNEKTAINFEKLLDVSIFNKNKFKQMTKTHHKSWPMLAVCLKTPHVFISFAIYIFCVLKKIHQKKMIRKNDAPPNGAFWSIRRRRRRCWTSSSFLFIVVVVHSQTYTFHK